MKLSVGWLLFVALLFVLGGAAFVSHQRDQASQALIVAVNAHDVLRVDSLLGQGADPNVRDWETYYTGDGEPFHPPWYEKYLAKLMRREPRPADPYLGPTVLMIAAAHGDTALVKTLLDHRADPAKLGTNCIPNAGQMMASPLWEAIENQRHGTESALLLIHRGADINATDDRGDTALVEAVENSDVATVQFLLENGAHADVASGIGIISWIQTRTSPQNFNSILLLLLSHGANVNARNGWGGTALIFAAIKRNLPAMKLLLSHGADVNAQDCFGRTALMLASYARFPRNTFQWTTERSAMQRLLRHYGANSHFKDKRGRTATYYECTVNPASRQQFSHSTSGGG